MEKPDITTLRDFRPTSGVRRLGVLALNNSGKFLLATTVVFGLGVGVSLWPTTPFTALDPEIKAPALAEAVEEDAVAPSFIKPLAPVGALENKIALEVDPSKEPVSIIENSEIVAKTEEIKELESLDLSDLANAIDNLGLRLKETEQKLEAASAEKPDRAKPIAVGTHSTSPIAPSNVTPSLIEFEQKIVEEADRRVYGSLQERLSDANASKDIKQIELAEKELNMFKSTIETLIEFRVVSDSNIKSGFWRSRQSDPDNKQYFLVVEAAVDGEAVNWAIKDTDTGAIKSVSSFGLGVDEATFAEFAADLQEDGKVNSAIVGIKPVGRIQPVWSVKTNGITIAGVK